MDALGHSSPFVIAVIFTLVTGDIHEFTTKEMAALSILVHIDCFTNLASWELLFWKHGTESWLHSLVERSTLSFALWWGWVDWDLLVERNPSSVLISWPGTFFVFVGKATVMPVASIPRPSNGGEAALGWTPVSPWLTVLRPSIPDLKWDIPFPDDLWCLCCSTVAADFLMTLILLNKLHACSLSVEDMFVLSVNLFPGFAIVFLNISRNVVLLNVIKLSMLGEFNILGILNLRYLSWFNFKFFIVF